MSDIIRLLPDSVANQIAAGEVIQRPSSAVKELLENAVDAGSSKIKLFVKDAGKALVQVIDNGCGMSETDARMSFERHATSKIRKAEDLFSIRSKGFRGEALASIAAVAQVELKTRRTGDELGTSILIEGSEIIKQEPVSAPEGTSFQMKNLFYNIPARRNFLKSNSIETRHIIEEFQRVALAHPEIEFEMHVNGQELMHLPSASLRQRVVAIFGNNMNEHLVPVLEETTILSIKGFVGKPEFSKKNRGEQYFFINNRFIRDPYLNHAVVNAYEQLLPVGNFPSYFLFIEMDPARIDINIHPTKTEVKFDDEKSIYAIIRSAVKHSLGQYSVSPGLDFNQEPGFQIPYRRADSPMPETPRISVDVNYNPFVTSEKSSASRPGIWKSEFEDTENSMAPSRHEEHEQIPYEAEKDSEEGFILQIEKKYILVQSKGGFNLIDQQAAHERILFERYAAALESKTYASQQVLFPQTMELSPDHAFLLTDLLNEVRALGFDIREFGKNTFVIHGMPSDISSVNPKSTIEKLLEDFKHYSSTIKLDKRINLARSMAKNVALNAGRELSKIEMRGILHDLFSCSTPTLSPSGKPIYVKFGEEELEKLFRK